LLQFLYFLLRRKLLRCTVFSFQAYIYTSHGVLPVGWHKFCILISKMVRLAIPVWNESVSTTFDFARQLVVADVDRTSEISRRVFPFPLKAAAEKARSLKNLNVDVLICGAISQYLGWLVARYGIRIVPFIRGPIDAVLAAYVGGKLGDSAYLLPGSSPGARKRWRHGHSATR
jgi:predicted Fe-Mo cluster-binding NifX family protein